jgi:eukaryotic-like serine/threonine-protein kinase
VSEKRDNVNAEGTLPVSEREPVRPRLVNPDIPHDLETIILKSIARDPKHRYQTAGELAEDLQCFLEGRPIRARRLSTLERLGRWRRRNRAASVAIVACLLAAIVALAGYLRTSAALDEVKTQKVEAETAREAEKKKSAEAAAASKAASLNAQEAKTAREKAEANVRFFWECFEQLFDNMAAADQRRLPVQTKTPFGIAKTAPSLPTEEDAVLMRLILEFYERVAEGNPTNCRLHQDAAKVYCRVGDIHHRLKQPGYAESAFRRATVIYEKLVSEHPDVPEYAVGLARTRAKLGIALDGRNKTKEAEWKDCEGTMKPTIVARIHQAPSCP